MRRSVGNIETESEYFRRLDLELIGGMRRRAASEERRHLLAAAIQTNEPAILEALEKLGYDDTTVVLLYLVPLVQVAWVDGWVSKPARDRIVAIASQRGAKEDTPAYQHLMEWLDRRPPDDFFEGTLAAIGAVFGLLTPDERKARKDALLRCCQDLAIASCNIFGWQSLVCTAKRELIEKISRHLEPGEQVPAKVFRAGE
jgi:hypothetical protein